MPDKIKELLGSRRLWSALAAALVAVLCQRSGMIDADRMATWLEMAFGIYSGSVGLEHVAKVMAKDVGISPVADTLPPSAPDKG